MINSPALFEAHVYGIIVNADGKMLFVKSTGGLKKFMFPGGTIELNESLIDGLKREIKEEVNLEIEVVKLLHVKKLTFNKTPQLAIYYLCTNPKGQFKLSPEHDKYVWEFPEKFDPELITHPDLLKIAKENGKN